MARFSVNTPAMACLFRIMGHYALKTRGWLTFWLHPPDNQHLLIGETTKILLVRGRTTEPEKSFNCSHITTSLPNPRVAEIDFLHRFGSLNGMLYRHQLRLNS